MGSGAHIKEGALLGLLSYLREGDVMESGSTWFGNPAVLMGNRYQSPLAGESAHDDDEESNGQLHAAAEYVLAMSDTMTIAAVVATVSVAGGGISWLVAATAFAWLGLLVIKSVVAWVLKWRVIGCITEGEHTAGSKFCTDKALVDAYITHVNSSVLSDALGTPFIASWYRALGATIGAGCWINTPFISEPDL